MNIRVFCCSLLDRSTAATEGVPPHPSLFAGTRKDLLPTQETDHTALVYITSLYCSVMYIVQF